MLASPEHRKSSYWKLTDHLYISGPATLAMHVLLFVPFFVYVALLLGSLRGQHRKIQAVMRNETKNFAVLLTSFLAGYGVLRILPDLKIITKYEMFPATQKSLILYNPAYLALGLILFVVLALYVVLSKFLASRSDRPGAPADLEVRHALLGVIMSFLIFLAFIKNSFLAILLLLPPAYLWMFMKKNRRFDSRLLNSLLFLGGLVSFIAICIALTTVFHVGIFYWYLFLAVSYGLISVYAAILAFAVITVGIRILRNLIL